MLSYFPRVYPEELLYSVMARYQRHTGLPPVTQANAEVLGKRLVIPSLDLQGGIDHLASLGILPSNMTSQRIIADTTILNYLIAYTSPKLADRVRESVLKGNVSDWYVMLGYAAFRVKRITILRFCRICNEEMLMTCGELYWHRYHQLPSSFVCYEHKVSLSLSKVDIKVGGRHAFIAADSYNCPSEAEPLVPKDKQDEVSMHRLHTLALSGLKLIEPESHRKTLGGWTTYYRRRFEDSGLLTRSGRINTRRLHAGVCEYYVSLLDWLPGLHPSQSLRWVSKLARKQRAHSHPLQHLLLDNYLDSLRGNPTSKLGVGPWPCRNPLALHYGKKVIRYYETHKNHGHEVAVFQCTCGYVYTRTSGLHTDNAGRPRFQSYGPLLKPALLMAIEQGQSLRAIARKLELDPKTVVRLFNELGIETRWRSGAYVSRAMLPENKTRFSSLKPPQYNTSCKIDWKKLDTKLSISIKQVAKSILASAPPVKLTLAEIERRIDRQGWLSKRLSKLPKTKLILLKSMETHDAFRLRRIEWAISTLIESGQPLFRSTVIRKANLRSEAIPLVDAAIQRFQTCGALQ